MRRDKCYLIPLLIGLCLALPGWAAAGPADQGVQPTELTLDNGLKLLLVERHEEPTVAACLIFDVGACNDPAGTSGIAHLFEHMMFKGSQVIGTTDFEKEWAIIQEQDALRAQMNAEMDRMRLMKRHGQIDDVLDPAQWTPTYAEMKQRYDELIAKERTLIADNELDQIYSKHGGARLNAGTSNDFTIYFVQLPSNKLELYFWLEADRFANPVMREFYVERENVREERRLGVESTPTGKYNEAFEALFWQTHPYGRPVLGWASEVESITRQHVRDFFKIYYAPNNATFVLVGDFDTDKVIDMARRYFGRLPRGPQEPPLVVTEEPKPIAERRFYAEAETNPQVRIRYHAVAMGHKDEAALSVAAGLLSGKSGRLYKRLVAQEDAVIGQPGAFDSSRKYAGNFQITATVKETHTPEQVEQLILEEVEKLKTGEISDYELQKVKNQVLADSVQRLRSNIGLMFQLAIFDTWYHWSYINESPKLMLAVTAEDVQRVMNQYLDPKIRTVAIFRTKAGAASDVDPELEALLADLPPEAAPQIKAALKQIKEATDLGQLRMRMQGMEQGLASGQIPEEQKALFEYMLNALKTRVTELETGEEETE